jgi:polyhydroxybutyrate depolymerase
MQRTFWFSLLILVFVFSAVGCATETAAAPTQPGSPKATQAPGSPDTGKTPGGPTPVTPGSTRSLVVGSLQRSYILYVPSNYQAGQPVAVVLVFHGDGANARNAMTMTGFNFRAEKGGFIAVFPNGTGPSEDKYLTWNSGDCCGFAKKRNIDDVGFVRAIIADLQTVVTVDPKRIYATGISNGGMMAYRLACELSDMIAAIGPVAATQNISACTPLQPVSVIHFHGTADQIIPYEGGPGAKSLAGINFIGARAALNFWVQADGCTAQTQTQQAGNVAHDVVAPCAQNTAIELYSITGGTHSWPGGQKSREFGEEPTQEVSATELIWAFFAAHPKP